MPRWTAGFESRLGAQTYPDANSGILVNAGENRRATPSSRTIQSVVFLRCVSRNASSRFRNTSFSSGSYLTPNLPCAERPQ